MNERENILWVMLQDQGFSEWEAAKQFLGKWEKYYIIKRRSYRIEILLYYILLNALGQTFYVFGVV